jgi:two-component system, NarL family, nitrate/nitrite response regulator NarL
LTAALVRCNARREATQTRKDTLTASLRIFICSDVRLYRDGLAEFLGRQADIVVTGTSTGGGQCLDAVRALAPAVVLLDMATAASVELLRQLCGSSDTAVVALGVAETEGELIAYAEAGIAGYITRDQALDDLLEALRGAAREEAPCSPRAAALLLRRVNDLASARPRALAVHLTAREREILALLREGLSNKQIGQTLTIELPTVKNHVHNILEKLGVARRGEAVAIARELTIR